jgi:hypothetical protein
VTIYCNQYSNLALVWTLCLMHKCVCIWQYILQNYNYKLHFQNSLSSFPQVLLPRPFHFMLPWKWTMHPGQAICARLLPLAHLVAKAHLEHWACKINFKSFSISKNNSSFNLPLHKSCKGVYNNDNRSAFKVIPRLPTQKSKGRQ